MNMVNKIFLKKSSNPVVTEYSWWLRLSLNKVQPDFKIEAKLPCRNQ